jgi:hypothetical protein
MFASPLIFRLLVVGDFDGQRLLRFGCLGVVAALRLLFPALRSGRSRP